MSICVDGQEHRLVLQIFDARRRSKRGKHLIEDGLVEAPLLRTGGAWMTMTGTRERVRSSLSLGRCCYTNRWT
jgi:hypothetical protein